MRWYGYTAADDKYEPADGVPQRSSTGTGLRADRLEPRDLKVPLACVVSYCSGILSAIANPAGPTPEVLHTRIPQIIAPNGRLLYFPAKGQPYSTRTRACVPEQLEWRTFRAPVLVCPSASHMETVRCTQPWCTYRVFAAYSTNAGRRSTHRDRCGGHKVKILEDHYWWWKTWKGAARRLLATAHARIRSPQASRNDHRQLSSLPSPLRFPKVL